ncbi:MAG: hypothetical protein O3A46_17515 [Candidatus Poribacteria bacterium]|nr:hypothetical protein [Candidatus Poribacteria bacterium]
MNKPLNLLKESASFQELQRAVRESMRRERSACPPVELTGVHGSAHAFLLTALAATLPNDAVTLCVLPSQTEARRVYHDLFAFEAERVAFFPLLPDILGEHPADSHKSLRAERIEALDAIRRGGIVVTSIHALALRIPPTEQMLQNTFSIEVGKEYEF